MIAITLFNTLNCMHTVVAISAMRAEVLYVCELSTDNITEFSLNAVGYVNGNSH